MTAPEGGDPPVEDESVGGAARQSAGRDRKSLITRLRDVVGVTLGVLLAFGIDAGWDEWQERGATREMLAAVQAELVTNRDRLLRTLDRADRKVEVGGRLLHLIGSQADSAAIDEILTLAGEFWVPFRTDLATGAMTTLVSSGGLAQVPDPELRLALGSWGQVVAMLSRVEGNTNGVLTEYQEALKEHVPQLELEHASGFATIPEVRQAFIALVPARSAFESDVPGLLADPRLENGTVNGTAMAMITANVINTEVLPPLDRMLGLLEEELGPAE